jgi:hypothetical protein
MRARALTITSFLILMSGCGPIIGQLMKASEGMKGFEVLDGDLRSLQAGGPLLVYGPFDKTSEAFYIARGEDAADFRTEMAEAGLFETELYLERVYDQMSRTAEVLRSADPGQIQRDFGLSAAPSKILFGTILHRETIVAPTRGLVMSVGYRLEFYDLQTGESTVIEMAVRDLVRNCIPRMVRELAHRIGDSGPGSG